MTKESTLKPATSDWWNHYTDLVSNKPKLHHDNDKKIIIIIKIKKDETKAMFLIYSFFFFFFKLAITLVARKVDHK